MISDLPPAQLRVDRREEEGSPILGVQGEIDLATAPRLRQELEGPDVPARRVVLDLAGLDFIDSTGVCLMLEAQRRADSAGGALVPTHVPAHARRLFQITGADTALPIEEHAGVH